MAPRAWIVGPDRTGLSVVIAGDKICWVGQGSPPPMPGASRLPCAAYVIQPGSTISVPLVIGRSRPFAQTKEWAFDELGGGTTSMLFLAPTGRPERVRCESAESPAEAGGGDAAMTGCADRLAPAWPAAAASSGALQEIAYGARAAGIRVLVGAMPDPRLPADVRAAEATRDFILGNRDPLVRGVFFEQNPPAEGGMQGEDFACVTTLRDELGHAPWYFEPEPEPGAYDRRFGRRIGVLEVGAVGDCVVRDGHRAIHAIVGGQLVLRDGEPPSPPEDRRRARWKRAEPEGAG